MRAFSAAGRRPWTIGLFASLLALGTATTPLAAASAANQANSVAARTTVLPTLAQLKSDLTAAEALKVFPSSLYSELTSNLSHQSYVGKCVAQKTAGTTVDKTDCVFGTTTSSKVVVLFGDSTAGMWMPAFKTLGLRDGFKLIVVARLNCPFAALPLSAYKDPSCSGWKSNAISYINSLHPSIVVFVEKNVGSVDTTAPTASVTAFAADVKAGENRITTAHEKVMLTGMPYVHYNTSNTDDPGPCIAAHLNSLTSCDTLVTRAFVTVRVTADNTAFKQGGGKAISITSLICASISCPVVMKDSGTSYIVFANEFHIPTWYAALIANALGQVLATAGATGF